MNWEDRDLRDTLGAILLVILIGSGVLATLTGIVGGLLYVIRH